MSLAKQNKVNDFVRTAKRSLAIKTDGLIYGVQASDNVPAGALVYDTDEAVAGTLGNAGTVKVYDQVSGFMHRTRITLDGVVFDNIAAGGALAVGEPICVLPAGDVFIHSAYMTNGLTNTDTNVDADTPDVGIGNGLASGANALLSAAGAGAEVIITGQTASDCTGTTTGITLPVDVGYAIASDGSKNIYLNVAAHGLVLSQPSQLTVLLLLSGLSSLKK